MNQQTSAVETKYPPPKWGWKRLTKYSLLFLLVVFVIFTTAIFHVFGPYEGKVVDLETGEPIEGVAVLILFYTEGWAVVDTVSKYAGAVEVVTDSNGEFRIRSQWVFVFHPLSWWDTYGYITIFKPGYGVYPHHDDAGPIFTPSGTIPERQNITFKLLKLKTIEERKKNIVDARPSGAVPDRKAKNLLKLLDEEETNVWSKK